LKNQLKATVFGGFAIWNGSFDASLSLDEFTCVVKR